VILTAHATKVNRTANVFGLSKSRLKYYDLFHCVVMFICRHTGWYKKLTPFVLYALILSNIDLFSNLFHCQNQENIYNNTVSKDPITIRSIFDEIKAYKTKDVSFWTTLYIT